MGWYIYLMPIGIVAVALLLTALLKPLFPGDSAPGWQVRCPKCGLTFDACDLGFVRIGAIGKTNVLRKCGQCNKLRWLSVERKPEGIPDRAGPRCDLSTHFSNA